MSIIDRSIKLASGVCGVLAALAVSAESEMGYDLQSVLDRAVKGKTPVVELKKGVWRVHAPIKLTAENLTIRGEDGTVISGGVAIRGEWKSEGNGLYSIAYAADLDVLIVNGEVMRMARYPDFRAGEIIGGAASDALSPGRLRRYREPAGAYFHALHDARWGSLHYRCVGRKSPDELEWEGGWQLNRVGAKPHRDFRFVENVFEELSSPGEWFHDRSGGMLYFIAPSGVDMKNAEVEAVSTENLLDLRNCRNVRFENLRFSGTARTFMKTREPLLRSDWRIYRTGAVRLEDTENVGFYGCEFSNLGGNAIFVSGRNRGARIESCHLHDCGASGVVFCGMPEAVRNPLFEYNERLEQADISRLSGAASDDYPADCTVEDCLIHDIGLVEKQSAGVQIAIASKITVSHCSIYRVPRAGINIGDGCFGGHAIRDCDIFDTVLETGDHGAFNSWGRDRYWNLEGFDANSTEAFRTAILDCVGEIVIDHNRFRCDHGWDVDLDDGSSHYRIVNNLLLAGGLKLREGFLRTAENNVIVNNSLHVHVWFRHSRDVFRHNVVGGRYKPIWMPEVPWGEAFDGNFRHNPERKTPGFAPELAAQSGSDVHSMTGDAMFVAPERGDYSLRPGSPALQVGFRNFPMTGFGVRSAKLKALAEQPKFDPVEAAVDEAAVVPTDFSGIGRVRDIRGQGDQSAYGLPEPCGVLVIESEVLSPGDVIVECNGNAAGSVAELRSHWLRGVRNQLRIIRGQNPCEVEVGE